MLTSVGTKGILMSILLPRPAGIRSIGFFLMSILLPRPAGTPSKIEGELRPRRFFVQWPETVCLRALGLAGSTVNGQQSTVNSQP